MIVRGAVRRGGRCRLDSAGQSICTSAGSREQRLIWRIGFFVSSTRGGCCSSAANGCNELASRAAASNERLFAGQQLIPKVRGGRCRYIDGCKAPTPDFATFHSSVPIALYILLLAIIRIIAT
jgi:hypothetical protein